MIEGYKRLPEAEGERLYGELEFVRGVDLCLAPARGDCCHRPSGHPGSLHAYLWSWEGDDGLRGRVSSIWFGS